NSSLTPPIPGSTVAKDIDAFVPAGLKSTIKDIERRLDAVSRRLRVLEYSQITLAWEAPLDGTIVVSGRFERGTSPTQADGSSAAGSQLSPEQFAALYEEVDKFRGYIDRKFDCGLWPED